MNINENYEGKVKGIRKLPKVEHTTEDSSTRTETLRNPSSNTIPSTSAVRMEIRRAAAVSAGTLVFADPFPVTTLFIPFADT